MDEAKAAHGRDDERSAWWPKVGTSGAWRVESNGAGWCLFEFTGPGGCGYDDCEGCWVLFGAEDYPTAAAARRAAVNEFGYCASDEVRHA